MAEQDMKKDVMAARGEAASDDVKYMIEILETYKKQRIGTAFLSAEHLNVPEIQWLINHLTFTSTPAEAVNPATYKALVEFYDKHNGTPCEQIRHQQEIEAMQAVNDGLSTVLKRISSKMLLTNEQIKIIDTALMTEEGSADKDNV